VVGLRPGVGVGKAGRKFEGFAGLSPDAFVAEVRARRGKAGGGLSPAALRALRDGYAEQAPPVQARLAEARAGIRPHAGLALQPEGQQEPAPGAAEPRPAPG